MIGAIGELLEWGVVAVAGWRFLLSPSYRKEKLTGWKNESVLYILWDICAALAGIAFNLLTLYLLYEAIFH